MANDNSRPDVAVFIDFENIYVSVRDKLDANPNFESIMDRCSELGRVVISRAYADWYRYPRVTSALYANGVEPMYVPTYYYDKDMGRTGRAIKNSADMNMCIDAMKTLFTNTNIAKFVLVTGDRDFIPLVNMIRQQGKDVIIIGIGGAASTHLAQSADEFIFYEQLIGQSTAAALREASRERDRQRSHERNRVAEEAEADPSEVVAPIAVPEVAAELDPFDTLVEAVHLARKRGYVCTLGSLKLVMKELMGGEFKESRYKDLSGRPLAKFKDFVQDAERRGKVQIFTSGTINEVFLPGEDPYKLSQFAGDLKEEPAELKIETPVVSNGRVAARAAASSSDSVLAPPTGRSRRRRRSRGGRQIGQPNSTPELVTSDENEELSALASDDVFTSEAEEVVVDRSRDDDELLLLPTDDDVALEDVPDLDRLEPLEDLDEVELVPGDDAIFEQEADDLEQLDVVIDTPVKPSYPSLSFDEAQLLAESEQTEATAAALVAEMVDAQTALNEPSGIVIPSDTEFEPPILDDFTPEELRASVESDSEPEEEAASSEAESEEFVAPQSEEAVADQSETSDEQAGEPEASGEQTGEPEAASEEFVAPQSEEAPAAEAEASVESEAQAESETSTEEPAAPVVEEPVVVEQSEAAPEEPAPLPITEQITFADEEWEIFRTMMAGFTKPVSFAQIFDSLRGLRQAQKLTRTNEQLRTLAKQAINSGMLERSGRGTRIYYRLPQPEEEA
jgi:uncharacterized protein (TIGR00288 family)